MESHADRNTDTQPSHRRRKDGCLTCRQRRVRCDRAKPLCGHCERLNRICRWPELIDTCEPNDYPPTKRQRSSNTVQRHTTTVTSNSEAASSKGESGTSPEEAFHHSSSNDSNVVPWATPLSNLFNTVQPSNLPHSQTQGPLSDPAGASFETFISPVGAADVIGQDLGSTSTSNPFDLGSNDASQQPFDPFLGHDLNLDLFLGLNDPFPWAMSFPTPVAGQEDAPFDNQSAFFPSLNAITSESPTVRRRFCSPVTPDSVDQSIATYFVERVSNAAITRHHLATNYYISLFAASHFCPALYAGMLAWSAWHMAATSPMNPTRRQEHLEYAERKHTLCGELLFKDLDVVQVDSDTELEAVYCTFMVYGQYATVTCAPLSRLRSLLDEVDKIFLRRPLDHNNSPLIQRMASILAQYDMKSSLFGLSEPRYTLHLGTAIFENQVTAADETSRNTPTTTAFSIASPLHMLYLSAQCCVIESQLRRTRGAHDVDSARKIVRLGDDLYDRILNLEPKLDSSRLDWFANKIHDPNSNGGSPQRHISHDTRFEIMLASMTINLTSRDPDCIHSTVALPLFFAGLETSNSGKYQEILEWFDKSDTGASGTVRVQRTKQLLEVVKRAEADGTRSDVGQIMRRSNYDTLV
ncbi:uncharacterized protein I303_107280 [Kwoniella dejecticola CBS 10117]|uniref:Zn(2)-C6 fungal-type domain-containing protein n=1 Tax=Kwoniella dejecticola CBS 10117 TaxID=1296121 RepID=A0A1A5ZZ85_9TREE|nr:uncharacterized protein I303_06683 [Kwoniella dejecticola CBS 10117]OBR83124.1 hypothetical protein I303_06683 [Kwoniella dejecticola CBS 10117]